ncbi:hypothetical protein [Nitrosophilus kaiyonis]|uniref:hypothetical protein n=1 Tax=Nitrosophilus kaiyonis TaxID=2930200 RepID=UPI0024932C81|nr:hypothetical protein [Nitrosophilus kaiyonis]
MRYILLIFLTIFLAGCNQSKEKPRVLNQTNKKNYANEILSTYSKSTQKDAKIQKEIALINMKKDIEKEKIKAQKEMNIAKIQKEKEIEKSRLQLEAKKEENSITKLSIAIFSILGFVFLIFLYFLVKKHNETKIAIEKEKLKTQKEIKEKEIKAQMASKIVEAIASGKLTKEQEEKLLTLANGKNILEYKR